VKLAGVVDFRVEFEAFRLENTRGNFEAREVNAVPKLEFSRQTRDALCHHQVTKEVIPYEIRNALLGRYDGLMID
jgi:hypothetical protein